MLDVLCSYGRLSVETSRAQLLLADIVLLLLFVCCQLCWMMGDQGWGSRAWPGRTLHQFLHPLIPNRISGQTVSNRFPQLDGPKNYHSVWKFVLI